mmetsp:Transcript_7197/g.13643  ORF Transcript_7197/g.13643 Transcript_7197/m.13643 type:complete len:105 (-) Transcript_7197:720-1034(-)
MFKLDLQRQLPSFSFSQNLQTSWARQSAELASNQEPPKAERRNYKLSRHLINFWLEENSSRHQGCSFFSKKKQPVYALNNCAAVATELCALILEHCLQFCQGDT